VSPNNANLNIAYLAQGKLHLRTADGKLRTIESRFGREVRERAAQLHQRNAWKTQGTGAQFMMRGGLLWGAREHDPAAMRIAITGLSWGCRRDELLYALETDRIAGVFAVRGAELEENRLFHTSDYNVRHLSAQPDGDLIACTLNHDIGTANIAVMREDGGDFSEVTEGDSIDLAPSWAADNKREIIFQSAGVARDQNGRFVGHGPFAIHKLNLDTGEMMTLAEDPKQDLLGPRMDKNGSLLYIKRPYKEPVERFSVKRFLLDILLFPFRLVYAVFQFLNFFTVRYTGKPLSNAGPAAQREMDLKRMMIWGNMVDAEQAIRDHKGEEAPSLVPKSWELIRRSGDGRVDTLARGVVSFDLCDDDSVVYSNGSAIFHVDAGGSSERLLVANMIEQVVVAG
jgi:hypothetical protein